MPGVMCGLGLLHFNAVSCQFLRWQSFQFLCWLLFPISFVTQFLGTWLEWDRIPIRRQPDKAERGISVLNCCLFFTTLKQNILEKRLKALDKVAFENCLVLNIPFAFYIILVLITTDCVIQINLKQNKQSLTKQHIPSTIIKAWI